MYYLYRLNKLKFISIWISQEYNKKQTIKKVFSLSCKIYYSAGTRFCKQTNDVQTKYSGTICLLYSEIFFFANKGWLVHIINWSIPF